MTAEIGGVSCVDRCIDYTRDNDGRADLEDTKSCLK
jgi:hypothetical protein